MCQISSTLYNAVIFADLDIVSRSNHMFIPSYVGGGEDATVVWGSIDFKFKNNRDYPIRIETSVSGGIATVDIYGLRNETEYDIRIESKTIKRTSSNIIVDAFKVYRLDGQVVKREKLSRDTYKIHPK
ncbi:MAG: VanW family protein [Clostridia bacterium]|nr:VanW family protein [Clostridia bacterium]